MNAEIMKIKGPRESDNPWQIGVPYGHGYRTKRDSSKSRRRKL